MTIWEGWCLERKRKNNQGKDPKTFEGKRTGKGPQYPRKETARVRTQGKLEESSKGENVSTRQIYSRRSGKNRSGKGRRRKRGKDVKHRRSPWWTERKEQLASRHLCRKEKKKMWKKKSGRGTRVPGRNNFWEDLEDGSSFS